MFSHATLEEFQKGKITIPHKEQIWLVNNPLFYENFNFYFTKYKQKQILSVKNFGVFARGINKIALITFNKALDILGRLPKHNTVIFLGYKDKSFDRLNYANNLYQEIAKKTKYNYVVVISKGDYEFTDFYADKTPENLKQVFANNVNTNNNKISYYPLGRDFRSQHLFHRFPPRFKKETLCYCNFSINTHPVRKDIYQQIKDKPFINFDHMGGFRNYSISRYDFYSKLSKSKFAICPRGYGIDTFRLWDSLYLGTIPIVVAEATFHEKLRDLPILFLDSYNDYTSLTRQFLEEKYQEMLYKKYNYKKLYLSYWINKMFSYIH